MNSDIFLSLLALDSYNHGFQANIDLSGYSHIGNAVISRQSNVTPGSNEIAAGFYALSYTITDGSVSGLAEGSTVISYRGTDNLSPFEGSSDIWNGWVIGAGLPIAQAPLSLSFYQAATGHSAFDADQPDTVVLTGHSLGGGLAGYVGMLSGNAVFAFDHMPFGAAGYAAWTNEYAARLVKYLRDNVVGGEIIAALPLSTLLELYPPTAEMIATLGMNPASNDNEAELWRGRSSRLSGAGGAAA